MKISLNMIRRFNEWHKVPGDVTAIGTDKLVDKINAQLGAIDEVINLGDRYEGIIIVKVVACGKHPDADKLQVCKVDDGGVAKNVERDSNGHVQVVCGAPNCRAGLLTAWLPPGTTVPASWGQEPFVVESREIRGQTSHGMLASPKELALGDSHEGILDIGGEFAPGSDFAETFNLAGDVVIDIENKMFTHRPDCFGFLGIARELAGIQHMAYKSPDWYQTDPPFPEIEGQPLALTVENELPGLVPRFTATTMSGVKVGPSQLWLQIELAKLGIKSINNIVDYSNWFMLLSGQPIHIYDYDKVKERSDGENAVIVVRNPKPGEKIKLLNGKTIEPRPEAMMVATDKELICLGGAMGGADTEVDESTTNIIIEAASWDMFNMRRTAMEHGIFTDAVTRFTKGQSPLQNPAVVARIAGEIQRHAGGRIAGPLIDDNHLDHAVMERRSVHPPVKVPLDFINGRLGLGLAIEEVEKLLQNVEFEVSIEGDEIVVTAPFWRTDIELREDVVEEVGRLYGYDKLPLTLPKRDLFPAPREPLLEAKNTIRAKLAKAGANEVLTYSFVNASLLSMVGQSPDQAFQIANALSPDLQYYRMSLMPSLLEKAHPNIKAGYDEFALFEIGKVHGSDNGADEEGLPREFEFTGLVVAAADKLKKPGAAYYQAKRYLDNLVGVPLEFKPVGEAAQKFAVVQPYNPDRAAMVSVKGGDYLGIIGEFKPGVSRALKLPRYAAGFEVDTTALQKVLQTTVYQPLSRFPRVTQDITLGVPAELSYQELFDFTQEELDKAKPKNAAADLRLIDIYQADGQAHKNLTFRLTIASYERTLTDAEVNKLLDKLAAAAKDKFGAERV